MALLESSRFQLTPDMSICRVLNGMWQVSGGHGPIEFDAAIDSMQAHDDRGFTTWDLADHYGPAEDLIGEFRRRLLASTGGEAVNRLQALTKWVPSPGPMTREIVESNIDVSLRRMNVEALDMLQFHWWAYEDRRYLDALSHLVRLRDEGRVRHLGLTNFDTATLERIVDGGFGIVSNQIQYSLVDLRPEVRMARILRGTRNPITDLWDSLRRTAHRQLFGPARAHSLGAEHGQFEEVQADDRRLGRLGPVPGAANHPEWRRFQARREQRQRGCPVCTRSSRRRGGDSWGTAGGRRASRGKTASVSGR